MPLLTLKPPRRPSEAITARNNSSDTSFTGARPPSPVAPAFSPITPKAQPVLPVGFTHDAHPLPSIPPTSYTDTTMTDHPTNRNDEIKQEEQTSPAQGINTASPIPPTQHIPQPPNLPFSSEDSTDAIALRAALSALQFQKQKARQDLTTLETLKQQALAHPEKFRDELAAGRLKEQRPSFGTLQDVLDAPSDASDGEEEVVLGASRDPPATRNEVPDSQPGSFTTASRPNSSSADPVSFPPIPGPQNIVRTPPINWEKYNVVGEGLESLHEQQRRWPGSAQGQKEKGREHVVAAPYSPFTDTLEGRVEQAGHGRNGSGGGSAGGLVREASVTGTVSEHPMETRRSRQG
ncbi:hypothetical protein B0A48_17196 [Cryoendolithus antarcticus]|uniref:Uncharacterized protein n=1 Tax=Cryoendolithus antarcticus TaxID=1507870 RepID=A0A1V8SCA1_9PEZI|nr:hypothetical protein B0A48_17196 [Cryoendolithus antarcticus]